MRNTMLIVVITVIATLAIDRVLPITQAQANSSSCADPDIPNCDAPERNYFSDATCGQLLSIEGAADTKEKFAGQLALVLRAEGCAKTIKPGGD